MSRPEFLSDQFGTYGSLLGLLYLQFLSRNFHIGDLRSSQFRSITITSQWENIELLLSSPKRMGSVQIFQNHALSGHLWWPRYNFSSVTSAMSFEFTTGLLCFFLSSAVARMKAEASNKHQCVCLVHAHRLISNVTYFGYSMNFDYLDLRSNFQFDLSRSCYASFELPWRKKDDGAWISSLSLLDKPGSAKNYFPKMHFLTFYLWSLNYWQMVKSEVLFQKKRFKRNRLLF